MRIPRLVHAFAALALFSWLSASPAPAFAYEDQLTLGVGLGYSHGFAERSPRDGGLLDLSASAGLGPNVSARARLSAAWQPASGGLARGVLGGELVYLLDVVQLVPWFGVGLDAVGTRAFGTSRADLGLHAVLGVDYLVSRALTLSLDVRPCVLVTRVSEEPVWLASTLSLVFMFEE